MVGIGASAGGVGAFQNFVAHVPRRSGIAWVLVQHMAPDRESHLTEILAQRSPIPVKEVSETTLVEPDQIYVIAPGRTMTVHDGALRSVAQNDELARRTSIDAFLLSLARDRGGACGCALLSGAGTDGTLGLKAVKEAGGITLTQDLGTAEYDGMLLSALHTGLVDLELPVENMPGAFVNFLSRAGADGYPFISDGDRRRICDVLRKTSGHDFSGYKQGTFERRVRRRMQLLGVSDLPEYVERLEGERGEPTNLFRDMLIGVTQFFRDPEAFAAVAEVVFPKILEEKSADEEVRLWIPGCSTGEEAYSFAMMLQEHAAALDSPPRLRLFASDIDDNALQVARLGRYPKSIEADVSPERLERFFDKEDGTYIVRNQLREICLFAQHNVLRDPPFSRIDLISCRNFLIYLESKLQKRLIPVFHYALRPEGFLFLGPAEGAQQEPKLFVEADRKHRIFRSYGRSGRLPEFPLVPGDGKHLPAPSPAFAAGSEASGLAANASRRIMERYAPTYVVIDNEYEILETSRGTGAYLELPGGRPRTNLTAMARSGLAIDVKSALVRVRETGTPEKRRVALGHGKNLKYVMLTVEPLPTGGAAPPLYLVIFEDMPGPVQVPEGKNERDSGGQFVRALELEFHTTKEQLQTTKEELETSNEELKASNEELSSVNEELQSSNEELETSREELQSINEELSTVNTELRTRVDELSPANSDLKNLFANTRIALLFLDRQLRIQNFTQPAKELFRLRDHDMGRPLDELAALVKFDNLKDEVRAVIDSGKSLEDEVREMVGNEPRTFIMRLLPYLAEDEAIEGAVLTLIDISERKAFEERLSHMVSELNHRVKNTLSVVQGVLHQSGRRASTIEEYQVMTEGRIHAMAAAHGLLSEADWRHADLRELAIGALAPFTEGSAERLRLSGPAIEVRPEAAVPLAMVLHELGTNALKYGAWSAASGTVELRWEVAHDDHGTLRLRWTEQGGPAPRKPAKLSFGLEFVRRSIEHQLEGKCRMDFAKQGFRCAVDLPTDAVCLPAVKT